MAYLDLSQLEKSFGPNRVVKDFSLGIDKGEFVSLLGPSGCGKTTVLRMVAGFEQPDSGAIIIDGQDQTATRTSNRNIGMVFQAYALFPNLNVADNVAFGLKIKGMASAERKQRVAEMLQMIGLPDLGNRYPYQLSGGQQQRVALARALAPQPRVLLLDEPLSALDAKIRVSLRSEIRDIQRKLGITTIFVTHDQEEALSISDRVVVMNGGQAEQIGSPHQVYNQPRTHFVANFVGTLNMLTAHVTDGKANEVKVAGEKIILPQLAKARSKGDELTLAIRPESVHLNQTKKSAATLAASVEEVLFMGSVLRLKCRVGDQLVSLDTFNRQDLPPPPLESKVELSFSAKDVIVLDK